MRKNKVNFSTLFPKIKRFPFRLVVFLLGLAAIILVVSHAWKSLLGIDYFTIKEVVSKNPQVTDLPYLKGKNIFSIDLVKESRDLMAYYPDYSRIKLIRILPDRIFVDFIKRKPVAVVKLYKYFYLDEEGVLFYADAAVSGFDLPVIVGLETKIFGPKPGRKYNVKEFTLALDIIKGVKEHKQLKDYKIKRIDLASIDNASIFIALPQKEEVLEIKISQDKIKDKIDILAGVLWQARNDLGGIKYIDLRFKETVIKLRDAK